MNLSSRSTSLLESIGSQPRRGHNAHLTPPVFRNATVTTKTWAPLPYRRGQPSRPRAFGSTAPGLGQGREGATLGLSLGADVYLGLDGNEKGVLGEEGGGYRECPLAEAQPGVWGFGPSCAADSLWALNLLRRAGPAPRSLEGLMVFVPLQKWGLWAGM